MGALVSPNELVVGWELPAVVGVDFVVDPFDDTCKFTFTQEIAFLFKSTRKIAMIKCDVKLEFRWDQYFPRGGTATSQHYFPRGALLEEVVSWRCNIKNSLSLSAEALGQRIVVKFRSANSRFCCSVLFFERQSSLGESGGVSETIFREVARLVFAIRNSG
ncbi:hypothetical protein Syun_030122 [Stephania yunnanensis]|uniref:RNA-dependent RNA polymerase 6-like second domain-containing protein n=1 Tax=Stephania yunnanensis TaxID=152371 RepID=A0AAP0EEG8_9MAGN